MGGLDKILGEHMVSMTSSIQLQTLLPWHKLVHPTFIESSAMLPEVSSVAIFGCWIGLVCLPTEAERKWFQAREVVSSGVCSNTRGTRLPLGSARDDPTSKGTGVQSSCVPLDRTDFMCWRLEPACFEAIGWGSAVTGETFTCLALIWTDLVLWPVEWIAFEVDLPPITWFGDPHHFGVSATAFWAVDECWQTLVDDPLTGLQASDDLFRVPECFSFQSSHANLTNFSSLIATNKYSGFE